EEPEEEEEEEEDEAMEDDDEDDAEVINPYEEADPHNRPPPTSDEETEFTPPIVQITDVDDIQIIMENVPPPNNNLNAPEKEPILYQAPVALVEFAPQWICGQIPDNNNALDSAVRANRSENSKMMRLITGLSREFIELKNQNRRAEVLSR
nr:hypothetical protein [Tanacetum cinerariifolium]